MANARDRWTLPHLALLGIALIGLVSWAGLAGMTSLREKARSGQEDLVTRQAEISKCVRLEQALPELECEVAELEGQLTALQALIPARTGCGDSTQKFENLAVRSGLGIVSIEPTRPRLGDGTIAYPVTMHVRGDLRRLRRFLDALRLLPQIYNVTSLHISQAKASWAAHGDTVEASLTIERFTTREDRPAEP